MRQLSVALLSVVVVVVLVTITIQKPNFVQAQDNRFNAPKWEYKILAAQGRYPKEDELNTLGENGWELVGSEFIPPGIGLGNGSSFLYFKRVKQ